MPKESALIVASHLTVTRRGKNILNDVSLTVGQRDFVAIVGPNGAGKSMLLKCLIGLYQPNKGTIIRQKALTVGYLPQRLVPEYAMPITTERFLRLRRKIDATELHTVSYETNIEHLLRQPLSVLSGGEVQRVLLARSLLVNPSLLVLDEPVQNLDIGGQLAFYKLLERLYHKRRFSILMVSHDLHMVMASTKQVIGLFHHVCCSGKPQAIAQDPAFISLFGRDMAKMMAIYQHGHDHRHEGESGV